MTTDEMRELIATALREDDRIEKAILQPAPDIDAIGVEDVHGDLWYITVEEL